jgi:HSP20 family protein
LLPRERLPEPCWKPPVDVLETETEIPILAALPCISPDDVESVIEGGALVVRGRRVLPAELRDARIHSRSFRRVVSIVASSFRQGATR